MPVPGAPRQRSHDFQAPIVEEFAKASSTHGDTRGQQSPPRREFSQVGQPSFFNAVDLDFTERAEEAGVGPPVSDHMFFALASTPPQDWPGWIEVDGTTDLFDTLADVSGDDVPDFAPFEGLFSHPHSQNNQPIPDSPKGVLRPGDAYRQLARREALSKSNSPIPTMSKDDRARKWSVVTSIPSPDDSGDVTEQLTNRLGRLQIAEDGHPRYFGSTSNLYILHHGPKSLHKPNIRDVMTLGDAAADKAGYHWTPDAQYEVELITLFFSWYNALVNVVDEKIFYRERTLFKSGKRSNLYSPALENAV